MVYLDYAANTPVDKEILDLYCEVSLKYYGNPNSNHQLGRESSILIEDCTKNILKNLGITDAEVIYTSGSTESNNLAIKGIAERYKNYGRHILLSSLEHNSIVASATSLQREGFEVDLIPVTKKGLVDIEALKSMLRPDTILVSVTSLDSELGLVQPIEEIGDILKAYPHTYFHTDATQAIGKVNIDYDRADLLTFAPHKFYGINGLGILIKKKAVSLTPLIDGGRSTTVYRSGTPDLASIKAADRALELAIQNLDKRNDHIDKLNKMIVSRLKEYKCIHINNTELSVPHTINFSIKGVKSQVIAGMLDEMGIFVSTKTSCCPIETPSKLVYALTKDRALSSSSIRVSLSHLTSLEEVAEFLCALDSCIKELKDNGKM